MVYVLLTSKWQTVIKIFITFPVSGNNVPKEVCFVCRIAVKHLKHIHVLVFPFYSKEYIPLQDGFPVFVQLLLIEHTIAWLTPGGISNPGRVQLYVQMLLKLVSDVQDGLPAPSISGNMGHFQAKKIAYVL